MPANQAKPTPGPWFLAENFLAEEDGTIVYCVTRSAQEPGICTTDGSVIAPLSQAQAKANAEFIVRACNSHQALLDALTAIRNIATNAWRDPATIEWVCKEIVKRAEKGLAHDHQD